MADQTEAYSRLNELAGLISVDIEEAVNSGNDLIKKASNLKLSTIILSICITVALGWTFLGEYGKNAAILLSAVLTGINTWDAFAKYNDKYTQEKQRVSQLVILLKEITFCLQGKSACSMEAYNSFRDRYIRLNEEYIGKLFDEEDSSKSP